jgi:hypothetical protein
MDAETRATRSGPDSGVSVANVVSPEPKVVVSPAQAAMPPDAPDVGRMGMRWAGPNDMLHSIWRRHRWSLVGVLAAVTIGLAMWGFGDMKPPLSIPDRVYDSIGLFHFATAPKPPYPAQLEVARWLGPFTVVLAGIWVLGSIFNEQATRLRVRLFYRNHLIICGLGRFGIRTAVAFRHHGYRVVVIDLAPAQYILEECREESVPVLRGDANQTALLRAAGLRRAAYLIAVCGEDSINTDIAIRAQRLLDGRRLRARAIECFIHIDDDVLCEMLEESSMDGIRHPKESQINFLNLHRIGPQALVEAFPEAFHRIRAASPHVIVVGGDRFAMALIVEAARRWWFAASPDQSVRPLVSLYAPDATEQCAALCQRFPRMAEACDLAPYDIDVSDEGSGILPIPELTTRGGRVTAFVCILNEAASLRATLRLRRVLPRGVEIVACTTGESGATTVLDLSDAQRVNMHAFPLLDRVCQPEVILNTLNEQMARTLHENYLDNRRLEGKYDPDRIPSHRAWDRLDETYREANRALAKDYFKNLERVGYKLVSTTEWSASKQTLSRDETELLAEAEHQRWCDERTAQGYTYGPVRDDVKKFHPNLVLWSELSDEDKEKDRQMMREISRVLARRGLAFVKDESDGDSSAAKESNGGT